VDGRTEGERRAKNDGPLSLVGALAAFGHSSRPPFLSVFPFPFLSLSLSPPLWSTRPDRGLSTPAEVGPLHEKRFLARDETFSSRVGRKFFPLPRVNGALAPVVPLGAMKRMAGAICGGGMEEKRVVKDACQRPPLRRRKWREKEIATLKQTLWRALTCMECM